MKNIQSIFLFAILILLIFSCGNNIDESKELLLKAENSIETNPDSALFYIGSITLPHLLNNSDYAKYAILRIRIQNKNNISLQDDNTVITKAINYYKANDDKLNLSRAFLQAGRIAETGEIYDEARKYYLDAIDLAKISKRQTLTAVCILEAAELSFLTDDFTGAIKLFDEFLAYYTDESSQKNVKKKIADCYFMIGKVNIADSLYTDVENSIGANNNNIQADILKNKALIQYRLNNLESAENLIDKAIQITDSNELLAVIHSLKADIHNRQKEYDCAYDNQLKVIEYMSYSSKLDIADKTYNSQNKVKRYIKLLDDIFWHIDIGAETKKNRYIKKSTLNNIYNANELQTQTLMLSTNNQQFRLIVFILLLSSVVVISILLLSRKYLIKKHQQKLKSINEEFDIKDETFREITSDLKESLFKKLLLYRQLIVKSLVNNNKNSHFLTEISRMIYNKKGDAIFDWQILNSLLNKVYNNFQIKLLEQYNDVLSEKEIEVILLQKAGFDIKEISEILNLTPTTIYHRNTDIRKKLNLKSTQNIITYFDEKLP